MEERIAGVLAVLKRLDPAAPVVVVDEIGWRVQELKNEVLASVTDDPQRRRRLLNQATQAGWLVAAARERGERALALAVAALQRELYAAEHPSISPQPQHRPRPGTQR
ncbi:hypothetical protein [Nocardia araoensis]|uniref:hypothetical protein n=1 Tax=Nocardia araoensis TaxID=228600 RepID=UPI0012F6887C|nr:hypothetical protein [Nocardia araoensis]